MANSLGTLSSALILQTALELTFTKRPLLNRISLNLSPTPILLNQQINTRIYSVPPVANFPSAAADVVDVDVPVIANQFKQVRHTFTAAELSATSRNLVQEAAEPMSVAIGNHLVDAIAGLWTPANFPNAGGHETVEAAADTGYHTANRQRKILTGRGAPDNRFFAVNGDVYEAMLNDPLCNRAQKVTETGDDPLTTGVLPGVAGFNGIFEYPAMPAANNLIGFSGSKDSIAMASGIPRNPAEVLPNANVPGSIGVVTIGKDMPGAGFSVLAVEWIDMATLSANVMLVFIYGVAKGNPNNGQRLVHTATA